MTYDRLWERLIEYMNEWASAQEVPGGIEVTFEQSPGVTRIVEVVVTSADWDDYISTIYGTGDPRATPLKEKVLAARAGARFLVYDTYDWEGSHTREACQTTTSTPGQASDVTDDDGNRIDRLANFDERD